MKYTKKEIEYPCDLCGKEADYNLQDGGYVLWDIIRTKKGVGFEENKRWSEGETENEFYCEKCAEKEGII